MKTRKKFLPLFIMLMGLLMLFGTGMTASAAKLKKSVRIKGVEYDLFSNCTATARIEKVRGNDLPTELYIPRQIKYKKGKYKVKVFYWSDDSDKYMDWRPVDFDEVWKQNVVIPDKKRSYQACLKKITFAKGVEVRGVAYGYEKLRQVVLEDPNNLKQALFYDCPKLKRLHIPAGMTNVYSYDIKNCPSLKITIDGKHKYLKMVGKDIYRKDRGTLVNVHAGEKNYKVPEGTRSINQTALWGNRAIETLHLRKSTISGIEGLPNLKRVKVNKEGDGSDKRYRYFYWNHIAYCPSLRSIEVPESIQYIYTYDYTLTSRANDTTCFAPIKHVYLYSTNLKDGDLKDIPANTTFHVRRQKVAKKLRKFGFKGKIVIEKNMK